MKKISVLLLFLLLVLVGCDTTKNAETNNYLLDVRKYGTDIQRFTKEVTVIFESDEKTGVKTEAIVYEAEILKEKAEAFNQTAHPSYLKHVHRALMSQNYHVIDGLSSLIFLIETGETSAEAINEAVEAIRTFDSMEELKKATKKIKQQVQQR